jgi:hypothetical protein
MPSLVYVHTLKMKCVCDALSVLLVASCAVVALGRVATVAGCACMHVNSMRPYYPYHVAVSLVVALTHPQCVLPALAGTNTSTTMGCW